MTPAEIKNLRARLSLTQEQLADRLGVSLSAVRRWEQGQLSPGADNIARLRMLASSPEVRAMRLSQSLEETAQLADANAADDIAAGDPESAEIAQRLAEHLRRLANAHREGNDPLQVAIVRNSP